MGIFEFVVVENFSKKRMRELSVSGKECGIRESFSMFLKTEEIICLKN
jgi:hypothetical protein